MRPELQEATTLLHNADAKSIERALALLQRTVFSFSMKICGHREDAEDTAQEVMVKSLPHLAALRDPKALSSWLYTAAKNRCWQHRRKASYQRSVALEELMPEGAELNLMMLADPAPGPEVQTLRSEDHYLLHQAVLRLPSQYRIVLVLHDMEDLDADQVAKILSLQPGTVRVRLHRARLMVRKEMSSLLRGLEAKPRAKKRKPFPNVTCREIFANLSEYLDGKLPAESCEHMRRHIEACPACVAFIQDLKRAIDRCRALDVCADQEPTPILRGLLTEEYLRLVNTIPAK